MPSLSLEFSNLLAPDKPTKIARVLFGLCSGSKPTRFDAERDFNDHTLNSTISQLANEYEIEIVRNPVIVAGYNGEPTRCNRYSIDESNSNLDLCYRLLHVWGYSVPTH